MKKRYIATAISVLLVLIGITTALAVMPKPAETVDNSPLKPLVVQNPINSTDIISLTNEYRVAKGLEPLVENDTLHNSACAKARHMIDGNYWSHNAPDGTEPWHFFTEAGYPLSGHTGENLAMAYFSSKNVVDGWISSPTHEVNLSGGYVDTGVCVKTGISYQGKTNTNLVVAHYGIQ